jgi:hypothetical protein
MFVSEHTNERIVRNNRVFRGANEQINMAAQTYDHDLELIQFLCECPVESCVAVVRLTEGDYAAVRSNPRYFITAPGHEGAEKPVGRVVAHRDGYVLIEKP